MIRYAGIDLTLPTPELTELLDRHYATTDLTPFPVKSATDTPPGCPGMQLGAPVPVRVNTLVWPTAPQRWAQGYFLVSDYQLACIRNEMGGQIYNSFEMWDTTGANTSTTSTSTTPSGIALFRGPSRIEAQLAIIGTHPLFDVVQGQKLHLLSLVDRRYFWWYTRAPVTTPTTWSELWTNALIQGGVGSTYRQIDAIPTELGVPSARWRANRWKGYQLPIYLDCAAQMTQSRVVCRMDETVRVERAIHRAEDQNQYEQYSAFKHLGGMVPVKDLASRQPGRVTVVFFSANDEACEAEPRVQVIPLSDLVMGGTELTTPDLCNADPTSSTSTSTTPAGCNCTYQFSYDVEGNLVLPPIPYGSNYSQPGFCPDVPLPASYPSPTGTPNSTVVVTDTCVTSTSSSTSTTCAGTSTTSTSTTPAFVLPFLPAYGTEVGVPETEVFIWADDNTPSYKLARRLAVDWYEWRLSQIEAQYHSCIPWVPTGFTDSLVFKHDNVHFNTRLHRVPGGPDNIVAVGLDCETDPPGETTTSTSTTSACYGEAILVNSGGKWIVETNNCSCGCSPIYPKDCPPDSCSRRRVGCGPTETFPPLCVTSSTTTTPYVGPPTTTTTPFCPTTSTSTTTTCAFACGETCSWYVTAIGTLCLIDAGCAYAACASGIPGTAGACPPFEYVDCLHNANTCGSCPCPVGPFVPCSIVQTVCVPPVPPPPPPPCVCVGACTWIADPFLNVWIRDCRDCPIQSCSLCCTPSPYAGCDPGEPPIFGPCLCDGPPAWMQASDYECGAVYISLCTDRTQYPPDYDPNDDPCIPHPSSTSTTTTASGCTGGSCKWFSATAGADWELTEITCPNACACSQPLYKSTVDCETAVTGCSTNSTTTSTTTTTTSTTTTTTPACSGACRYAVQTDGFGNLTYTLLPGPSFCTGVGCSCPAYPVNGGEIIPCTNCGGSFIGIVTGDCTDDPPPSTTTTPGPTTTTGVCGGCTINVLLGQIDSIDGCTGVDCNCWFDGEIVTVGGSLSCPPEEASCSYVGTCFFVGTTTTAAPTTTAA